MGDADDPRGRMASSMGGLAGLEAVVQELARTVGGRHLFGPLPEPA